jgi:hypothetical protein
MIKLTWAQVGLAAEPGQYDSQHGVIEVTAGFGANIPTRLLF